MDSRGRFTSATLQLEENLRQSGRYMSIVTLPRLGILNPVAVANSLTPLTGPMHCCLARCAGITLSDAPESKVTTNFCHLVCADFASSTGDSRARTRPLAASLPFHHGGGPGGGLGLSCFGSGRTDPEPALFSEGGGPGGDLWQESAASAACFLFSLPSSRLALACFCCQVFCFFPDLLHCLSRTVGQASPHSCLQSRRSLLVNGAETSSSRWGISGYAFSLCEAAPGARCLTVHSSSNAMRSAARSGLDCWPCLPARRRDFSFRHASRAFLPASMSAWKRLLRERWASWPCAFAFSDWACSSCRDLRKDSSSSRSPSSSAFAMATRRSCMQLAIWLDRALVAIRSPVGALLAELSP